MKKYNDLFVYLQLLLIIQKNKMDVKENTTKSSGHSIEWGGATWNNREKSIRNRYDNVSTGKFNKSGSGEIPWEDFKLMIKESISRGQLNNAELGEILDDISTKLKTLWLKTH